MHHLSFWYSVAQELVLDQCDQVHAAARHVGEDRFAKDIQQRLHPGPVGVGFIHETVATDAASDEGVHGFWVFLTPDRSHGVADDVAGAPRAVSWWTQRPYATVRQEDTPGVRVAQDERWAVTGVAKGTAVVRGIKADAVSCYFTFTYRWVDDRLMSWCSICGGKPCVGGTVGLRPQLVHYSIGFRYSSSTLIFLLLVADQSDLAEG